MITAAPGTMHPLPVRPHDGFAKQAATAPMPSRRSAGTMHPLPFPGRDDANFVDAIRSAAFQRMLDRVQHPLPVVDPSA